MRAPPPTRAWRGKGLHIAEGVDFGLWSARGKEFSRGPLGGRMRLGDPGERPPGAWAACAEGRGKAQKAQESPRFPQDPTGAEDPQEAQERKGVQLELAPWLPPSWAKHR